MNRSNLIAALLTVAALGCAAAPARAQVNTRQPIEVQPAKVKLAKFRGEVVNANLVQITVRSAADARMIYTFRLSPKVRDEMVKIMEGGGYQVGDKVEIHHEPGSDVVVRIKGKPSKPKPR